MNPGNPLLASSVARYCARLGADPLLVQGAGGNVSWKEGDVLWIKASGTWLSEAMQRDIFVPVDLRSLRRRIGDGEFGEPPEVLGTSRLRPSIETMLHALVPYPVVVHLHAIDVLARLVRESVRDDIAACLGPEALRGFVPYRKPGVDLAREVAAVLSTSPACRVVLLGNHGIVIGGEDVDDVDDELRRVLEATRIVPPTIAPPARAGCRIPPGLRYEACDDPEVNTLATSPGLLRRVRNDWALYPDHVVFLGPTAVVCTEGDLPTLTFNGECPPFVFVEGRGVLQRTDVTRAQGVQLRCYWEVLRRQADEAVLSSLTDGDVGELMNWDAEKYRQAMARERARP